MQKIYRCMHPLFSAGAVKLLFMMKLTIALIMVTSLHIYGNGYSQTRINISLKDAKIKKILNAIQESSGYRFIYNDDILPAGLKISVEAKDETVSTVLDKLFNGTGLVYRQFDSTLIGIAVSATLETDFRIQKVNGVVTDEKGTPLRGVSVVVKDTRRGTATDDAGRFSLDVNEGESLEISMIGFRKQLVPVSKVAGLLEIRLLPEVASLTDVVVVGYGVQKRATKTGAVSAIKGSEIKQSPNAGISNAFAGRISGVIANNRTGEPGYDGSDILIRGRGTTGNNSPLIVVDGVINRGMDRLNSSDIESISVLKDAAAAIYGVQGANGVIVVTTKRGKKGKPTISYEGNYGFTQPTRLPKFVASWEYATFRNEARARLNQAPQFTQEEINKYKAGNDPVNYPSTDWFRAIIKDFSPQTSHNLSLNGGNEAVRYYISGQYLFQDGIYKSGATKLDQFNLRSNLDANVNKNLKVSLDIYGTMLKRNYPRSTSGEIFSEAMAVYPTLPAYYPNGKPGAGIASGRNPALMAQDLGGYYRVNSRSARSTASFEWKLPSILPGLYLSGLAAYDFSDGQDKTFTRPYDAYTYDRQRDTFLNVRNTTGNITLTERQSASVATSANFKIGFDRTFNDHSINAFVAYEQYGYKDRYTNTYRGNFLSDQLDELFAGDPATQTNTGSGSEAGYRSYFGRVVYGYKEKYLAEFTYRYAGSFNFPKDKRYGTFPAVSVGWRISEESFFKPVTFVDNLKIRASWAQLGNDKVGQYQYLTRYNIFTRESPYDYWGYFFGSALQRARVLELGVLPNPNITWEKEEKRNIGLDASFLQGKLTLEFDYFFNQRSDILAKRSASVPLYTGFTLPDENIAKVTNRGIDLSLMHTGGVRKVQYHIGLNFTYAKNKVVFADESANVKEWMKQEGHPMGGWLIYKTDGIYRTQEEVNKTPHIPGSKPGDIKYLDVSGDGKITSDDRVRIDRSNIPEIMYGIPMGASYRGISLNMLWTGQARVKQLVMPSQQGSVVTPQKWFFDNRWTVDNPGASLPSAFDRDNTINNQQSDFWLKDGSFLRLKSLEIGYQLPASVLSKLHLGTLRVFANGSNLLSIDKLKKYSVDPELNSITTAYYPQVRIYNFGLNLSF